MARRALVAAVIAAALSLAGVGVATAAPPEGSLRLTLVSAGEEDLGPRSFSFTDTVYQRGKVVGTSRAVCRVSFDFWSARCKITVSLPGGKLFVLVRCRPRLRGASRSREVRASTTERPARDLPGRQGRHDQAHDLADELTSCYPRVTRPSGPFARGPGRSRKGLDESEHVAAVGALQGATIGGQTTRAGDPHAHRLRGRRGDRALDD